MIKMITISFIFILFSNLAIPTSQYQCGENGNYTSNSTYRANLRTLLASLPSNIPEKGFYSATAGRSPDVVNAIVLCRGDVDLETCRACTRNATRDLETFCPNEKEAYQWLYLCMLRYSHEPIYGTMATYPSFWGWEWENATMVGEFKANVTILLHQLRVMAAGGGGEKKVAAGNRTGPEFQTIYALVQCTPDMSPLNCSTCLNWAMENLPRCCNWRRGAGIFMPSCNLRYGSFEFYSRSMLQESPLLPIAPLEEGNKSAPTVTIIIIIVPIVGCLVLVISVCTFLRSRKKQKLKQRLEIINLESLQYDFETIRNATGDFSGENKLGQGGFGIVYKGKLVDGQEIAVKRLSMRSEQGDLEFKNEVLLVAKLQHKNLVRLLGFCLNETERILVYEFVLNASLDHFIFDMIRRQQMDWDTRYNIIKGIAKGLVYLHEDSHLKIIHRDLKANNVLLDEEMNPKIADFGLARLIVQDKTHDTTSRIAGTYGYMSPEYVFNGHISIKSDVFSFGVMALEIISGQKNSHFQDEYHNIEHLLSFAWRNWQSRRGEDVIDPILKDSSDFHNDDIFRCIHIGLLCVQENAGERPTMTSVVQMINNTSLALPMPSKPGFFMQGRLDGNEINNSRELELGNNPIESRNEASITEMCPR